MCEFAMRAVDLAPLVEQRQDLLGLVGQDAVHRGATRWTVGELSSCSAGIPAVGTDLAELEHPARTPDLPAGIEGLVDQVEQACLGGRIDPVRDSATQPQPSFPSTRVSFTASSLQASESRAISALACSSS